MALHRVSSHDDTLANNSPAGSLSQFESFPPLLITRSNVLNTPSLRLEPILSRDPDEGHLKAPGSRRWFILSLSCLLLFGNYFAYDNPAALNTQLQKYLEMPYNEYQYLLSTLYSVYSLPNTVLPFLFGSLVDTLGPQRVLLMLSSCVCIGQTIFSIGVQTRQVWMMLLGRAIFGIGGESCGVAQASITTMYFRGHELAFALGLNLCIARFGSVVNAIVTPWAEQKWGVPIAIWIGTLSCVASFMSAVVLVWMIHRTPITDSTPIMPLKEEVGTTPLTSSMPEGRGGARRAADQIVVERNHDLNLTMPATHSNIHVTYDDEVRPSPATPHWNRSSTQPTILQHLPGILRRETSFVESIHSIRFTPGLVKEGTHPSLHILTDQSTKELQQHEESWWNQWRNDLQHFPLTFWLICTLTVLLYGTVVPFNNVASDFLQSKWYPGNPRKAAAVMGIPDTIGALLVPGFGWIVDRYGRRASVLIVSAGVMVVVHSTLGFTMINPIFAFSLLGIAYSMYGVALWPSIACVITNELHLGKGYGISSSFLNISLTIVPPIVATIRVVGDSFLYVEMFFIVMGLTGILVGFVLKVMDRRDGGALEEPEIHVEVPVIIPQTAATSACTSAMVSPALSTVHSRAAISKQRHQRQQNMRPGLSVFQSPASGTSTGIGWPGKRWVENEADGHQEGTDSNIEGQNDPLLQRKAQEDMNNNTTAGSPWYCSSTLGSPSIHTPSTAVMSPMTERMNRHRRWFSRPLLHRGLTRVGSPLLQQYSSSPRYGSISSPSIASPSMQGYMPGEPFPPPSATTTITTPLTGAPTSMEEGFRQALMMSSIGLSIGTGMSNVAGEGYSVSQHPILYNPLRGSTGSFRISRNARPVSFGEGEEGRIYVDGQMVTMEPGLEGCGYEYEDGDEYEQSDEYDAHGAEYGQERVVRQDEETMQKSVGVKMAVPVDEGRTVAGSSSEYADNRNPVDAAVKK